MPQDLPASMEASTSAAVTGEPSENFAVGLIVKTYDLPSLYILKLSHSTGSARN